MANKSKRKGMRIERRIADRLQLAGLSAVKVSRTGYRGPDLSMPLGADRTIEVKARSDGFRKLYGWLQDVDFLIVCADHSKPLVVLRMELAAEIAMHAERWHAELERREEAFEKHKQDVQEALDDEFGS